MKNSIIPVLLLLVCATACTKDNHGNNDGPEQPDPVFHSLKNITYSDLPSPYYRFQYDAGGKIDIAGFSADMITYKVHYNGSKIAEMESLNEVNKERLLYDYMDGELVRVRYLRRDGTVFKRCYPSFNEAGFLESLEWEVKDGPGFVNERTYELTYDAQGNLTELRDHRFPINEFQEEALYIDKFEDYDTHKNVEAFSVIHKGDDHLLLLQGKPVQKNNPRKVTRTGSGTHWEIVYNYVYRNNGTPQSRSAIMTIKSGPDNGTELTLQAGYSYF